MSEFDLGRHEQAISTLLAGQARLEQAVARIEKTLAERRGERRVMLWLLSTTAGVVGAVVTLVVRVLLVRGQP